MSTEVSVQRHQGTGKRKSSIARVSLVPGEGRNGAGEGEGEGGKAGSQEHG